MTPVAPEFAPAAVRCPACGGDVRHWAEKTRDGRRYQYDRCLACDFAFVNPRPTRRWLDEYYGGSTDGRTPADVTPFHSLADVPDPGEWPNRLIGDLVSAGRAGGHLLDVGAGGGWFTSAAVRAGLTCTALELDPADLADLRRLPNVAPIASAFEAFEAPPASFDFVLMSHVLEHARDPREWIAKAALLLADGGVLAVVLPHFNSIYRLLGGTVDPYFFPPEHLNHFNRRSLGRLAVACGLTPVRWSTVGGLPPDALTKRVPLPRPVAAAARTLTRRLGFAFEQLTQVSGTGPVLSMLAVHRAGR